MNVLPLRRVRSSIAPLVLLVLAVAPAARAADEPDALARALQFAKLFLAADYDKLRPMMDGQMRDALGRGQLEEIAAALKQQLGEIKAWGEPWVMTDVPGYRVVRVPATMTKQRVDYEVSVAPTGKVGGFFVREPLDRPGAKPADKGAADAPPVKEIELRFGPEGKQLPGTLALPEGKGPFPAVVLVHGSGPHDRDETLLGNRPFRDIAHGLAARGIATFRFDMRSVVRPDDFRPLATTLTVREEKIDDAVAALALLRTRPEVDPAKLYVLGHSLGGMVAPRIAAAEPRPAGMILLAPAARPIYRVVAEQVRYIASLDGTVSDDEAKQIKAADEAGAALDAALAGKGTAGPTLGAPFSYWKDLAEHDPATEAAALGLPLLFVHGSRDYQVTQADVELFRKALDGKAFACLLEVDGDDHLFRRGTGPSKPADYEKAAPMDPRVIEAIAAWISGRTCPAAR